MMQQLGVAHQMLLLGMLSLSTQQEYARGKDLGLATVLVTVVYLLLCLTLLVAVFVEPVLRQQAKNYRVTKLLASFGLPFSETTKLYIVPSAVARLYSDQSSREPFEDEDITAGPSAKTVVTPCSSPPADEICDETEPSHRCLGELTEETAVQEPGIAGDVPLTNEAANKAALAGESIDETGTCEIEQDP
jgi:hypothetical protein